MVLKYGKKIKKLREQKGWTQAYLARKVNITPAMMCTIEKEESTGSIKVLTAIAKALNIKVSDLLE